MRKIAEISGDEFFDVVYALSPLLPMIANMEIVKAKFFNIFNDGVVEARTTLANEKLKEDPDKQKIKEQIDILSAETAAIFARDISNLVPLLSSRENRGIVFETLSILEQKPIEEIKHYSPPKLISRIKQVMTDTDFKSFLTYAEPSEQTE